MTDQLPDDGADGHLEAATVRALLRLSNRLHRLPLDPAGRKRHFVEGLCDAVGADGGVCVVARVDLGASEPLLLAIEAAGSFAGRVRQPLKRSKPPKASRRAAGGTEEHPLVGVALSVVRRSMGQAGSKRVGPQVGSCAVDPANGDSNGHRDLIICSAVPLTEDRTAAGLVLRRRDGRPPFDDGHRAAVGLFHEEARWIYDLDLPLASPDVLTLSRRARETLQHLLTGAREKEIAKVLELSTNTVHHYVKRVYRHFGVSSRTELLARWGKK